MRYIVNERSIKLRRKRALRESLSIHHDAESKGTTQSSSSHRLVKKIKALFSCRFWEGISERTDDETLVDTKLMSYAYFEIGIIETIGSWECSQAYPFLG